MLYTETFDDVPAVFSTNNTSDAGFGFIVNEVNSSETPTFVQGPHSFQPKAGTIVSADISSKRFVNAPEVLVQA